MGTIMIKLETKVVDINYCKQTGIVCLRAVVKMMEDIKKNGQKDPIILGKNRKVLDGNVRLLACHRLGLKTVKVVE